MLRVYFSAVAIWLGLITLAYGLLLSRLAYAAVPIGIIAIFSLPFLIAWREGHGKAPPASWWLAPVIGAFFSCATFAAMVWYPISRL